MLSLRRAIITSNTLTNSATRRLSTSPLPHAPPSSAYYDDLIDFAGRNRDFSTVEQLLNKRAKSNCFNTSSTFKFISTNLSILDDLLKTISNLNTAQARKDAYKSLISQLSKLHQTQKALKVAEEMITKEHGTKAATFHPILNSATRRREMKEAWVVLSLMKDWKIPPDTTSYNYLLTAYCYTADLKSAVEVLDSMIEYRLKEDERTYDALVLGACKAGKMEAAVRVMGRMVEEGVVPIYSTYAHVINGMCREGLYGQAVEFVRSFGGRDGRLDGENYGVLGVRLVGLKRFDEAKVVVEEMKKRNLVMGEKLRDFYQMHVVSTF